MSQKIKDNKLRHKCYQLGFDALDCLNLVKCEAQMTMCGILSFAQAEVAQWKHPL